MRVGSRGIEGVCGLCRLAARKVWEAAAVVDGAQSHSLASDRAMRRKVQSRGMVRRMRIGSAETGRRRTAALVDRRTIGDGRRSGLVVES